MNVKHASILTLGAATGSAMECHAATGIVGLLPVQMSMTAYIIIGFLLISSIMMFFVFQRRFKDTHRELMDVTGELGSTRQKLVDTSLELDISKAEHKASTERYSGILFNAETGMFQMDAAGRCVFVNTALQRMSGLYPKKALKEGVEIAIHPEDREGFTKAWDAFVQQNETFDHRFRFMQSKGVITHVRCRANTVLNAKKEVESYIAWCTDETELHQLGLEHTAETGRYDHFIAGVTECFYKLEPKSPISVGSDAVRTAEQIMREMTLTECNDTFAAMYGANAGELVGKAINELSDGCGPFKNNDTIKTFVESGCEMKDMESTRQDPNGNRLNLTNNVVGLMDDGKLVAIWGVQRNISQQKREKAELSSQVTFMKRILNSLPADVHVKDTRCRYLYASKKMADRTGIPQEDWIGKTIFEVMPGTPREHDQNAIDTMKSGKMHRVERTFEARGKKGWMEIIQTPLVSEEELVEGVIALSLDVTDRKLKEEEARHYRGEVEKQLKHTKGELAQSRIDYGKTATTLSETIQKLKVSEAQRSNREHEHQQELNEQKTIEETLRRSEQGLLARQQQLERQLADRLAELDAETDKRKKWEELIAIKEDELRKIEENMAALNARYEQETNLRHHAETNLSSTRSELETTRNELNELAATKENELETLQAEHTASLNAERQARAKAETEFQRVTEFHEAAQERIKSMTVEHADEIERVTSEREQASEQLAKATQELETLTASSKGELERLETDHKNRFDTEHRARSKAEHNLARTKEFLDAAQERVKTMTDEHAVELEKEVAERKSTAEKLIKSMEELDDLRQSFSQRLQEETKTIKQELAKKQIREKAMRQHEKDLEKHIQELEATLQNKSQAFAEQIQAREGAEVEKQQIEEKLEQLTERQKELVARETQRLNLNMAEIRLQEVKLRKHAGELEQANEDLTETLQQRDLELEKTRQDVQKTQAELDETQNRLKQFSADQERTIAQETNQLKHELEAQRRAGDDLGGSLEELKSQKQAVEQTLQGREVELQKARQELKANQTTLSATKLELEKIAQDRDQVIARETKQLSLQMDALRKAGDNLKARIEEVTNDKTAVENKLTEREADLAKAAREYRKVVDAYKQAQTKLKELAQGQEAAITKATGQLETEMKTLQHSEEVLKRKESELTQQLEKHRAEISALKEAVNAETNQREAAENELQAAKEELDASLENADAVVQQRTRELEAQIDQFKLNEEALKQEIVASEQSIKQRDESLSDLREEHTTAAKRLEELESKLAGIKEEHQAEIKQSLAEVQEVVKANSALVDELNEEVQTQLNPVVKTAVMLEAAENVTDEQKKELAVANLGCRALIDTMNYRAELTHVADGSDEVETEECDLHTLITDIDHQFCHRAETKKLFFAVSFAQYQAGGNVPKWVETDEGKLRKTLSILLGYAINRVEKGRVGLHATRLTAENGLMDIAFELTYTAADTNDELLTGVFGGEESNGIDMKYGLTLARQYVSMMGGEAKLEQRDAGVTALTVTMPFKRGASAIILPGDEKQAGAA